MTHSQIPDPEVTKVQGELALEKLDQKLSNRPSMRQVVIVAAIAAITAALLIGGLALMLATRAASDTADLRYREDARNAQAAEDRKQIKEAQAELRRANKILKSRGQEPVDAPGPNDDLSETLASAAAAQVLAELPNRQTTAGEIAEMITEHLRDNPQGPSSQTLAGLIADYLRDNPPPRGEKGDPGEPGTPGEPGQPGTSGADAPPPTQEQINAAVVTYCLEQPGGTCEGPTGAAGKDAPVPVSTEFVTNSDTGDCEYVMTFDTGLKLAAVTNKIMCLGN